MSLATGYEAKAHCQACGIATTASPNAESRRAVWASTVAVPDGIDQASNIVETDEEDAESASGVGNTVPRKVEETKKKNESAVYVSSVGNEVPRGFKKTSTRSEVLLSISRVDNHVPRSESETLPIRPVEDQYNVFDGVSGRHVKAGAVHLEALSKVPALLNLEELSMNDFLAELKATDIAEMVLVKPETSPDDLNPSSVMDEDVLEGFTKRRATRLGSEILKNPEDPVALDLVDGYYQILTRKSDIPLTTVSAPSGMLWEWLVIPQGLSNASATFNRLITQLFRPLRTFAQTYFDDIFVHSRAEDGQTAMGVRLKHLRRVFEVMRANKLYANIDKCVFAAEEIKVLGCFVSRVGVRADTGKIKAIAAWPTPRSQKDLQKWLGLINYLRKYTQGTPNLLDPCRIS
ncbi:Retrovirus Polyprotein [Phytophthora palmivora]|uniref:Retrovirus Polyprotein n=1 Tax=Phytophthora palmivora TaxID=4796 RepID=A0A2P4Y7J2_9STRA|nr:Retrovirus Polyprotein [Phytophthora palmivora]